jgi:hypothetical protein
MDADARLARAIAAPTAKRRNDGLKTLVKVLAF